jgi:hypothetical protein
VADNSDGTARSKRPNSGRPFTKGDPRINRNGAPKRLAHLVAAQTRNGEDIVAMLLAIAAGEISIRAGESDIPPGFKERLEALEQLADRLEGKPKQSTAVTGEDGGALVVEVVKLGGAG